MFTGKYLVNYPFKQINNNPRDCFYSSKISSIYITKDLSCDGGKSLYFLHFNDLSLMIF